MAAIRPNPQNDGERLIGLETEMCEVREDVRNIAKDVKDLQATTATKDDVQKLTDTVKAVAKSSDEKYASKLTERIVYGLVVVACLAVVYAVLQSIGLPAG